MANATSSIVFTGIAGSTSPRAGSGERVADQLFRDHQRALGEVIEEYRGHLVKTSGDGVMATFDSASAAIQAAVKMQQCMSRDFPDIRIRVGVAAGDVSWEEGDCFGLPVVTAARLQAMAEGGQILVSSMVRWLGGERAAVTFRLLGPMELKGLPEPVETFEVEWEPLASSQSGGPEFQIPLPSALDVPSSFAFVGRHVERDALASAWAAVRAGARRTVLIGGEAGAGKTRLAFEFARQCARDGAGVVLGVCDSELALPYQPWVEALDHLLRATPRDILSAWTGPLAEVSVLLPQLESMVTGLARPPATDPNTERHRLFQGIDAILTASALRRPLIVLLDDLHWAGAPTLSMLRHLARSATPSPILIIGTFRDTSDEITGPLASCLADLRRTETTSRLRLSGLDPQAVEQFVAGAGEHDLDPNLRAIASTLREHSGGNAFYLGELWRHMITSGTVVNVAGRWQAMGPAADLGVPDSVREVVSSRVTKLRPPTRRILQLIALAGQRVELRVLHGATGPDDDDVDAALDELTEANLLTEVGGALPVYQFAHAIVRDTVKGTIPASARARLHMRIAESIELVYESDRRPVLAELARHYVAAAGLGTAAKARYYARRASSQAMRSVAYDQAIDHLTSAFELAAAGSAEGIDILIERGDALMRSGLHSRALFDFVEAFRGARETGLTDEAVRSALGLGMAILMPGLPGSQAVEILTDVLSLVAPDDSPMRTRLEASLASALYLSGRSDEAERLGEQTLAVARRQGDMGALVAVLQAVSIYEQDTSRRAQVSEELCDLALQVNDMWAYCWGKGACIRASLEVGDLERARAGLVEQRIAASRGRFLLFRYQCLSFDVMMAMIDGRFEDAERFAEQAHEFGASAHTEFDSGVYGMHMYAIRREQGRLGEILPVLRIAAALQSDEPIWRPGLAALFADVGLIDEAKNEFELLAPDGFRSVPRDGLWPACLTFLAEVCVALSDVERAQVLYSELQPFQGMTMTIAYTACFGPAERLMGSLCSLMGRRDQALAHFQTALEMAERSGSPVWKAHIQHAWAAALGDRPDLMADARATAVALGIGAIASKSADSHPKTPPVESTRPGPPNGLSAREIEVLQLVATGKSNRQIGERLTISQNTAANHVRAILQKTGSSNRAEATAYAARHGLLG